MVYLQSYAGLRKVKASGGGRSKRFLKAIHFLALVGLLIYTVFPNGVLAIEDLNQLNPDAQEQEVELEVALPPDPVAGVTIEADKVVCLSESDLPNWGGADTPVTQPVDITNTTAANFVAASGGRCHLETNWSFQYGFAEHDNTGGVNKLIGNHVGPADGTSTAGMCNPTYCGNSTNTGTAYNEWKNFDTTTSGGGTVSATVVIPDLQSAPGIWVRENLKTGYTPFTYPPNPAPGSDVTAEIYCHDDIENYDNYDEVINPVLGNTYHCVAFNVKKAVTINADKVVCLTEADLPNWGGAGIEKPGKPSIVTGTTASDYVAASNGRCHLQTGWSFQYGFAEHDNTAGVHKLPGDFVGPADGTSTAGLCGPAFCGNNTFTGTAYNEWKNFDSATSVGGTISAMVNVSDLEGAPGIWVRENLKTGFVPFTYPPDNSPGSDVTAEIYCHDDIQNYDNYDEIVSPVIGQTYNCVAFNAPKNVTINALKIVCLTEADLPNWGDNGLSVGEPAQITATTAADYVAASNGQCHLQPDWSFQYGFAEHGNTAGVHKLPGDLVGPADGTSTAGLCPPTYCGVNTATGTGYADWKTFDTATSSGGAVSATVNISNLENASGIWVRENLQTGYVPFTYPPETAPGSNVSAEIYCHDDIQNFDNYDEIISATVDNTYYCVAFNALKPTTGGGGSGDGGSGGSNSGGSGGSGSGGPAPVPPVDSSTSPVENGSVLGAATNGPTVFEPEVLGAATELPRTGMNIWELFAIFAGLTSMAIFTGTRKAPKKRVARRRLVAI